MELALEQFLAGFELFFGQSTVPAVLSDMESGEYVAVNDSFLRLTGLPREQVLGATGVQQKFWAHPEERERLVAQLRQAGVAHVRFQYVNCRTQGYGIAFAAAQVIQIGQRAYLLGLLIDVEEIDAARRAAERVNQHLELVLEAGDIGLWDLDLDTGVAWRSAGHARIFGHAPMDLDWSVERLLASVHPDDRGRMAELISKADVEKEFSFRILRPDQSIRYLKARGSVVLDESGRPARLLGMLRDVTAQYQLEATQQLHSAVLGSMREGVMVAAVGSGIILYANPTFENLFGYPSGELAGRHASVLNARTDESPEETARIIMDALEENQVWHGEVRSVRKDGTEFWSQATVSTLVHPELGRVCITVQQDITRRKAAEAERDRLVAIIEAEAVRDALTGLHNRRFMEESLLREISAAGRGQTRIGLIFMDIDHFKAVNDNYSHAAGDEVLKEVGELLRRQVRGADIACRFGGEEFLLVLPKSDLQGTHKRAEQLRLAVQDLKVNFAGRHIPVAVSAGVAVWPEHGKTMEEVIGSADRAMYAAKQAGRNCVRDA